MKKLYFFLLVTTVISVLTSCSSSNKVASSFGKRRYMKGYYMNLPIAQSRKITGDKKPVIAESTLATKTATAALPAITTDQPAQQLTATADVLPVKKASQPVTLKNVHIATNSKAENTSSQSKINEDAAPLSVTATESGGSTSRASIYGFIFGAIGFAMAIGAIGAIFVPVICLIGLLLSIHGLQKRDYKLFAILGIALSCIGLALWLIGIIAGHITFSWI